MSELRVFDGLLSVRHALHRHIIKELRKAGIGIAFPQRDIHVRPVEGLGEVIRRQEAAGEGQTAAG